MKSARRPLTAVVAIGSLALAGVAATAPGAQANSHRNVPQTRSGWVADAHSLGAVSGSKKTDLKVYLAPKGGLDALEAAVTRISTPGTADYGHYLSAAQYHAQYDPTAAQAKQVRDYLKANHVAVTGVGANREYLSVRGTNAAISKAFGVSLRKFNHAGQSVQANTDAVTLPDAVAGSVLTVTGLDTTRTQVKHQGSTPVPPPAGFANAAPCSSYYGEKKADLQGDFATKLPKFMGSYLYYAPCGYTGPQYRAAYQGANPDQLDGTGVSVGILDAYDSPWIQSDVRTYASRNGDAGYGANQLVENTPTSYTHTGDEPGTGCGASGWFGEQTLDIEAVHAMAGGAKIQYYGAKSCYDEDFLAALKTIVNQNKVSIVSNSWGEPEGGIPTSSIAAYQRVFLQGASQGISFMFSSGDDADEVANTGIRQSDNPTSSPYVTSVGGTADAIGGDGSMLFQTGWGTHTWSLSKDGKSWLDGGYLYGAGGGESKAFNQPSYQAGVVPPAVANGRRAVPDIAMDADPQTGMLIGQTQQFTDGRRYGEFRIGGTSLASPLFAGQTALLQQHAGKRLGLLNPVLYKLAGSKVINDVKGNPPQPGVVRVNYANGENPSGGLSYIVRTFNQDESLVLRPGWDEITGIGSPNPGFITAALPTS